MLRGLWRARGAAPRLLAGAEALAKAADPDTAFLWLDVTGPFGPWEGEFRRLAAWHPVVFENFLNPSRRPRLVNFGEYSLLTLHALDLEPGEGAGPDVAEIDAVLGGNLLVTSHAGPVEAIARAMAELEGGAGEEAEPDRALHLVLSRLVDKYLSATEAQEGPIRRLEEEALRGGGSGLLERIVSARDRLIDLHRSLAPQHVVVGLLATGECPLVRPFVRPFFKDDENRLRHILEDVASYKEMAGNSLELYRSAMNGRTNDIMKLLTVLSTLLLPLTFLTGLFGMNVPMPFGADRHAFEVICVACIGVFAGMWVLFRRRGWF